MSENYEFGWTESILTNRELLPECQAIFGKFNRAWLSGKIEGDFEYCQHKDGRNVYKLRIGCLRKSGVKDIIPVIVPEELISINLLKEEVNRKFVEVGGEIQTHNSVGTDGKRHLNIYLFAKYINICENEKELKERVNLNLICLEGYICVNPIFRETPFGRKISDVIIAVTRFDQNDYIPVIAWGYNAYELSEYKIGDRVSIYGRIQSRQYSKKNPENPEKVEIKEAYEVSITNMQLLK